MKKTPKRFFVYGGLLAALWAAVLFALFAPPANAGAENPSARYIGTYECLNCHLGGELSIFQTAHGVLFEPSKKGASIEGCEACHGPGGDHIKNPNAIAALNDETDPAKTVEACVRCHVGEGLTFWKVSDHADGGLTCLDCHRLHKQSKNLLKFPQTKLCAQCHSEKAASAPLPGRHPLLEAKMDCSDCHSPHGSLGVEYGGGSALSPCVQCHQERVGPFVYEHEPVSESCIGCHMPHGSANRSLLSFSEPGLCKQCHAGAFVQHPIDIRTARTCSQCHTSHHGSNADPKLF